VRCWGASTAESSECVGLCCSDDGTVGGVGLRTNVTITATVRNINDVPVWVPMPNVSVPENSLPSAVLFTVRAIDDDVTDKRTLLSRICWCVVPWRPNWDVCARAATVTYSIVGGNTYNGATAFTVNATTGTVHASAAFNFEAPPAFVVVQFRVDDNASVAAPPLFAVQSINITFADVNEAPVLLPPRTFSCNENLALGTVVHTVVGADVDAGDSRMCHCYAGRFPAVWCRRNAFVTVVAACSYIQHRRQW
jgi:hypothetical protein